MLLNIITMETDVTNTIIGNERVCLDGQTSTVKSCICMVNCTQNSPMKSMS